MSKRTLDEMTSTDEQPVVEEETQKVYVVFKIDVEDTRNGTITERILHTFKTLQDAEKSVYEKKRIAIQEKIKESILDTPKSSKGDFSFEDDEFAIGLKDKFKDDRHVIDTLFNAFTRGDLVSHTTYFRVQEFILE